MAAERWIRGLLLAGIFGVSRVAKVQVAATVLDGDRKRPGCGRCEGTETAPGHGQLGRS
jgi:hypothetical protein